MLEIINMYVIGTAVPILLIGAGVFLGARLRFFWLLKPRALLRPLLTGASEPGGVSPRRALMLALAGTLGVGNIVGVSAAIFRGGPGAVFWMWLSALAASSLKYAETVLAMRRRRRGDDGVVRVGTPYYIRDVLSDAGLPRLGVICALLFALSCLVNALSMGCVVQVNAVSGALEGVLGADRRLTGAVVALLTAVVASGGLKRISGVTSRLVPAMSVAFCLMSFAVLLLRADALPAAFTSVIRGAFDFSRGGGGGAALSGGVGGYAISRALRYGTMRGLISNEAGAGTSPMAHSASESESPTEQGFMGIVEVFVDTVFLCTVTAAVILVGYDRVAVWGDNSVMMTVSAYSDVLGGWAEYVMCLSVLLFGFATLICQSYYGLTVLSYLTPSRIVNRLFVPVFAVCAYIGAVIAPGAVWGVADLSIGIMTLINLPVLLLAAKEICGETAAYFNNMKRRDK